MNSEDKRKNFSNFISPFEEDREAWEEIYGLDNYDNCSDYEARDYDLNELGKQRIYDLDKLEFPTSFVSFDFENLFPQRVTACSVGMVKYKNGVIVDTYYTLIRPPFEY